jgi:hypothetical protein
MFVDATGAMPSTLVIEADQHFLSNVPQRRAEKVLVSSKLTPVAQRPLDMARHVTLSTWFRQSFQVAA